jgi:hypothetical protein
MTTAFTGHDQAENSPIIGVNVRFFDSRLYLHLALLTCESADNTVRSARCEKQRGD